MKIAVGSKNPVKIAAVETVAKKIWPDVTVIGIEVEHGTSIQPNSDEEAMEGATNRAQLSLQKADADYGFGLEGNTQEIKNGMLLSGWVVVVNKQGQKGIARCASLLLPEKIAAEIRKGKELGPISDEHFGTSNLKQKEGSVGLLTNGMTTRTDEFERGVICALARFLKPEYY